MNQQPHTPNDLPAGLRRYVEAAREQPIVGTCVTAEAVAAGLEHQRQRSQTRRTVLLSGVLAVAASLVAVGLLWPLLSSDAESDDRAALDQRESDAELADSSEPSSPTLASAVRVRSTASIEVRDAWSIVLGDGSHELEVDALPDHALAIELPERNIELVHGHMTIEVVEGVAAVRLHTGVAAWIDEHGERTSISVDRIQLDHGLDHDHGLEPAPSEPTGSDTARSAAELARDAELLLESGKREQAIEIYRQLIRKHPRASQTRAATLDLARLLRTTGRTDEARCAYRLYLERWPDSSVRAEVESQLTRLGKGPACRGLSPTP